MRWQFAESPRWWSPAAMLQQLWSLIPRNGIANQWLLHCRVVVVSERLALLQAREWAGRRFRLPIAPINDALLRALQ